MVQGFESGYSNEAVDGLNLLWHSDLVVSGGGTMNREAAALGVPVYSIFRGKIGAVDRHLQSQGKMTLIESIEDVQNKILLTPRNKTICRLPGQKRLCGDTGTSRKHHQFGLPQLTCVGSISLKKAHEPTVKTAYYRWRPAQFHESGAPDQVYPGA